jgi:hypothetical protein
MKNLYLLPTDQQSRLVKIKDTFFLTTTDDIPGGTFYNIYITNDEEIGEGDWYLDTTVNVIFKNDKLFLNGTGYKKIILSTDPELITDGVQAIDDEFLLWFVKMSSCEFVVIDWSPLSKNLYGWKIIIPQEEPKEEKKSHLVEPHEQETFDEAALKWVFQINGHKWSNNDDTAGDNYGSFIAGAKWQTQRMYSEDEVYELLCQFFDDHVNAQDANISQWFEQNKKK